MSWLRRLNRRALLGLIVAWIVLLFASAWLPALWVLWQARIGRIHGLAAIGVGYSPAFWFLVTLPPLALCLARWYARRTSQDPVR